MKRYINALIGGLALLLASMSVSALTLDEARRQGRVGETLSGYLASISSDPESQALVDRINKERRQSYSALAKSHNVPMEEVARLAGQKLVSRPAPGEYVRGINGRWMKK
ncbi:DUF1318 domain-containing protein [Erwinia sp. CPCC 100877]|nr:DUF1318 domain-containing protein [Erwinia sp. CPCC 100877]